MDGFRGNDNRQGVERHSHAEVFVSVPLVFPIDLSTSNGNHPSGFLFIPSNVVFKGCFIMIFSFFF